MASSGRLSRGVVLMTTLLVLALLAAIAWQMVGRHSILIAQYRQGFAGDQALAYALGAETFARQILHQDWAEGGPGKDTLLEMWAQAAPPFEIDNGSLEIQARDLHGCFNLNSLALQTAGLPSDDEDSGVSAPLEDGVTEIRNPPGADSPGGGDPGSVAGANLQRLRQLLRNLDLPDGMAETWQDWVDADQEMRGFGAEDPDYLLLDPAYRTANAPAAHVSELRLLKGMEPEMVEVLAPLVCTLPTTTLRLNVNTAPAEVLAALSSAVNPEQLVQFTEGPRDLGDITDFTQQFPDLAGAVDALSVSSEYFEISVLARVDDTQIEMVSVLRRDPSTGRIELLSRDLSRNFRSLFLAEPVTSDLSS